MGGWVRGREDRASGLEWTIAECKGRAGRYSREICGVADGRVWAVETGAAILVNA